MSQDYGKNLRSKSCARSVYQHSISPNFLFHAPGRGDRTRKIGPKNATEAERIYKQNQKMSDMFIMNFGTIYSVLTIFNCRMFLFYISLLL